MAIKCNTHKDDNLDYLPHMGWFCDKCEKDAGNVTLDGYAPERESKTVNRQAEKGQLMGEVFDNLSAQETADLLVRRVLMTIPKPKTKKSNIAHWRYVRMISCITDLLNESYKKIDNGLNHQNEFSILEILYDKGYADYMENKTFGNNQKESLTKDQMEAYHNGWEKAWEDGEYGNTNN